MTTQERDRIESAIRHIQTSVDIDPWAMEIAVKAMEKQMEDLKNSPTQMSGTSDLISRQAAIDLAPELIVPNEYKYGMYNQAINNYCAEIMQLPSAQPEQQWIPCSERLPQIGTQVLCCNRKGSVFTSAITYISNGIARFGQHHGVIAWMPLPEVYREGEK